MYRIISFLLLLSPTIVSATPPAGYSLVFNQTFNNSKATLSIPSGTGWGPGGTTVWICHPPTASFGSAFMSGPQDAADGISPFRFDPSGYLRIKAWFDSTRNHWRTGLLSSLGDAGAGFSVANGYYECRMWIPRAGGTWPAFWLETNNAWDSKRTTNAIEIDIAELYGDQAFHDPTHTDFTTVCHQQMHDWTPTGGNIAPPGSGQATTVIDPATGKKIDFAAGWHTYACLVQGSSITWYIDDQPTFMLPMPADGVNQPFFVMVDLALGGGWPIDDMPSPSPNANPPGFNRYPQELAIAWIRVYAH